MQERRIILTQDLDFTSIIALSGHAMPSSISLRLESSLIESVNAALQRALPALEQELESGARVTVEEHRIRLHRLPLDIQDMPSL